MSQAVEKPVKLFIDAIKLFLILNLFFFCLTLPIKQIENEKPNSKIDIVSCDDDALHGIRSYRHYESFGQG